MACYAIWHHLNLDALNLLDLGIFAINLDRLVVRLMFRNAFDDGFELAFID